MLDKILRDKCTRQKCYWTKICETKQNKILAHTAKVVSHASVQLEPIATWQKYNASIAKRYTERIRVVIQMIQNVTRG